MTPAEAIAQTFAHCAAADIDITAAVYAQFFATDPAAHGLMGHSDEPMRGRMLDEVLLLLMSEPTQENARALQWEVDNHLLAYGVQPDMYEGFFKAVKDAVQGALADAWLPEHEQAWNDRITQLHNTVLAQAAKR